MKNIYIVPTDKPSRLYQFGNSYHIQKSPQEYFRSFNIYITSTDEITDCNCYVINVIGDDDTKRYVFKPIEVTEDYVRKAPLHTFPSGGWCEKIILTTDSDLINDGVQAINDEFLKWFVKNPSYEFVDILDQSTRNNVERKMEYKYKIIIPNNLDLNELEQASEDCIKDITDYNSKRFTKAGFKLGTKWQSERMYSEDEVWNIMRMVSGMKDSGKSDIEIGEYFENNKKK